MAELVPVRNNTKPNRRGDVVFVHGLNGNPREYWCPPGEPDKYWPAWLGEDLPDVGIWSLDYEGKSRGLMRAFTPTQFSAFLIERAEGVLERLEMEGIGERPLVFVAHGVGGLLVKQLIHRANDSSNANRKAV